MTLEVAALAVRQGEVSAVNTVSGPVTVPEVVRMVVVVPMLVVGQELLSKRLAGRVVAPWLAPRVRPYL